MLVVMMNKEKCRLNNDSKVFQKLVNIRSNVYNNFNGNKTKGDAILLLD